MLRTRFAVLAVVAVASGFSVAATAGTSIDESDLHDYSFGVGSIGPGCQVPPPPRDTFCTPFSYTYRLLAVSRFIGDRAWGTMERRNNETGGTFAGPVRCLKVAGNRAAIGGILNQTPNGQNIGVPFLVYVVDNGPLGSPVPDQASFLAIYPPEDPDLPALPADFPRRCPSADSIYGTMPLTSGDVTVTESSFRLGATDR